MLCRCLLIVLLIFVVPRVRPLKTPISRYFCDSKDKISEALNLKSNFKRFFRHQDQLYFVFKKRIIFGRQPLNDADTDAIAGSSLVLFNQFEQTNVEKELTNIHIRKEYQVMGYYKDRQKGFVLEIYHADQHKEKKIKVLPYGLQLEFADVLAERTKKIRLDEIRTNFGGLLSEVAEDPSIIKYLDVSNSEPNYKLLAKFRYYSDTSKLKGKYRNELMVNYSLTAGIHRGVSQNYSLYEFPDLKWFVVYPKDFDAENATRIDWFLLGVNENTFDIHFVYFPVFDITKPISSNDYLNRRTSLLLTYDELFSCHTPFKSEREIKGIFYDRRVKVFFVFVKRFYLKFEEDLFYRGFYINLERYLKAKNIPFESEKLYRSVEFEMINRKWVKTFQQTSYLIPNSQTFEIGVDENNDLKVKTVDHIHQLRFCMGQTLVVESAHVYCFKDERYSYWYQLGNYDYDPNGSNYTIESIFQDTAVQWQSGQRLLFIFNFQVDRIVFMTRTHLFMFRYGNFRKEEDQKIGFAVHPDDDPAMPYIVNKNCLVAKCNGPASIQTTMFPPLTTEPTTAKPTTNDDELSVKPSRKPIKLKDIKWYLTGLSLAVLIVLIIAGTWYLTRKKRHIKAGLAPKLPIYLFSSKPRLTSKFRSTRSAKPSSMYTSSVSQYATSRPPSSSVLPSDQQLESGYPSSRRWRTKASNKSRSVSTSSRK